jgi:transposase
MSNHFSGPQACEDGAFISIRYRDIVPDNHPVRYIDTFIEGINITSFQSHYKVGAGMKGRSPKDVRLLLKVILYALFCRIYSARKIDYATEHYADFWFFTHGERISHDKISDFIIKHSEDIHLVFLETIGLASHNELLDFSALYEDGFKVKANASIKRSYKIKSLDKQEQKLSDNLAEALAKLGAQEEDETAREERKETQNALLKIAALREELQQRIAERSKGKPPSKAKVISENARINMTDSDAEVMRQKDNSNAVSYLKETAIDPKTDIVIGSEVSGHDNEIKLSLPLAQQANQNCKDAGCTVTYNTVIADARFPSLENCADFEKENIILIGPTQNSEHQKREPDPNHITFRYNESNNTLRCSEGRTLNYQRAFHRTDDNAEIQVYSNQETCRGCPQLKHCTKSKDGFRTVKIDSRYPAQQRVYDRYLSEEGQALYKKRSHVAETYQGDLKQNGRFLYFLRRGIEKVKIDSRLHDIVWNLRRIINAKGSSIVWGT